MKLELNIKLIDTITIEKKILILNFIQIFVYLNTLNDTYQNVWKHPENSLFLNSWRLWRSFKYLNLSIIWCQKPFRVHRIEDEYKYVYTYINTPYVHLYLCFWKKRRRESEKHQMYCIQIDKIQFGRINKLQKLF